MLKEKKINYGKYSIASKYAGNSEKAIFFVHGNSQNKESWDLQMTDKALLEHYLLISFDLPGHGDSDWFSDDPSLYTLPEFGKVAKTIIEEYAIKEFILVGLSYGTNVIAEITGTLNGCRGVVLAGCHIINNEYTPAVVLTTIDALPVTIMPTAPDAELEKFSSFIAYTDKSIPKKYIESYKRTDTVFRAELLKMITNNQWSDELENLTSRGVPVLVVYGRQEKLVNVNYLKGYNPLWNGQIYFIENSGHVVNQEKPAEFNKLLLSFGAQVFK